MHARMHVKSCEVSLRVQAATAAPLSKACRRVPKPLPFRRGYAGEIKVQLENDNVSVESNMALGLSQISSLHNQTSPNAPSLLSSSLQNSSATTIPHMSATALLQKAAQVGASSSGNNMNWNWRRKKTKQKEVQERCLQKKK